MKIKFERNMNGDMEVTEVTLRFEESELKSLTLDEVSKLVKTRLRVVLDKFMFLYPKRSHCAKSFDLRSHYPKSNENANLHELNVGQLKKLIKEMDDDTPIAIQASTSGVSRFVVATYDNDIFDEGCLLFTKNKVDIKNHYSI